jgi:heme oxygenase (biliverdin-IX-beta and delta-forming)
MPLHSCCHRPPLTDISRSEQRAAGAAPVAPTPPGVVSALRAATAERHQLLHRIMPLGVDSIDVSDYFAHLQILRAWLAPLQAWLDTFDDGPQSAGAVFCMNRLALIEADLAGESAHGQTQSSPAPDASATSRWSGRRGTAYRWGICYVIEGSRLGGATLYAQLHERFAPHPLSYLKIGREALGPQWRGFTATIGAQVQAPEAIREACEGAADAFDSLSSVAWLGSKTRRQSSGFST